MALVPGRQFCPTTTTFIDSLHSSLSRTRLQFFRYNSSIPFETLSFSPPSQIPRKKSHFGFMCKPSSQYNHVMNLCRSSWIDKWNEPHQQNHPKRPRPVLNYRCSKNLPGSVYASSDNSSDNSGVSNSSGSTMEKIMERLKKVGYSDEVNERKDRVPERVVEKGSIEDIFYVEEGMLPNTRGGFSEKSLLGLENVSGTDGKVLFPWEKPKEEKEKSLKKKRKTYLAELTLPAPELNRLRYLGFHTKSKTRIGGAGVTHAIVDAIHEKWKVSEIVRLRFEGSSALNMRRMHEILERKTGGLVIWRSGTSVILYRGSSYDVPTVQPNKQASSQNGVPRSSIPTATDKTSRGSTEHNSYSDVQASPKNLETTVENKKETDLVPEVRYEDEIDKLLDSLGPRYTDWPGDGPLPVDADLLPATIPGYEPPFRILPYGVRCNLGLKEATALRRISRPLPPHFALGRSRQLQGLAVAMTKLWERTLIAKVALKRNVQLTTSERMAENIKKLTGGILLSRNKDFLVFYRGKSFLSKEVAEALLERERLAKTLQDDEEQARLRASTTVEPNIGVVDQAATAGTLGETVDLDAQWGKKLDDNDKENMMREIELERHAKLVRKLEGKLAFAERKLDKAEHALSKVEVFLKPTEQQADPESITDEERFMFRKLGLRMKAFLLLGRRGVFDGTVENMHLHWKYRELVKILLKAKSFDLVRKIALSLEAESGGVLVSVDRVSKGYAIIVFRGKDYQRPSAIRPKNLLTKRKALARSIELQRREALLKHIAALERQVEKLRAEIEQVEIVEGQGDGQLYDRLDSTYPTDDEESEEEGDEAYLGTYGDGNEDADENDDSIQNLSKFEDDEESEADEDEAYLESYGDRSEHEDESNDSTQNLSKLEDESNDINHNVDLVTNSAYDIQNQAVHP